MRVLAAPPRQRRSILIGMGASGAGALPLTDTARRAATYRLRVKFLPLPPAAALALALASCVSSPEAPTYTSLDGRPLEAPAPPPEVDAWLQAELDAALARWRFAPTEMNAVWVGRRLAYKGLYGESLEWYAAALGTFPESFRLRRHMGHRLLTVRRVEEARDVLEEARRLAADAPNLLEPDGAPGPFGAPRSTTHGNIDYHLALALYALGDFEGAETAWRACLDRWAANADAEVAALHWLVMCALQRGDLAGARRLAEHPIDASDVIENHAYLDLVQMYRGDVTPDDLLDAEQPSAAALYGVARWLIATGDEKRGRELLDGLVGDVGWASFGVLAAEADVRRSQRAD